MAKPRPCVVPCCLGEKFELVHKFPTDRERAELWKTLLNVPELAQLDVDTIRNRHFVCSRHFCDSDYKNKLSRSLNMTANPSLNLTSLSDAEGLNRVIPPMLRNYSNSEQHQPLKCDGSLVTLDIELQAEPISEPIRQTIPVRSENNAIVLHRSQKIISVFRNPPPPRAHKRPMLNKTNAGCTPARIFKFKRKLDASPEVINVPALQIQPSTMGSVVLKKVKIISPQKKSVAESITELHVQTVSTETQTDLEEPTPEECEPPSIPDERQEEMKPTTKVLALLECTPENLQKLQRKMKECTDGALPFDDKLFSDFSDEHADNEMKPTIVDEQQFLTLQTPETEQPVRVSYIWLRDHCRCKECYNHETFQRSLSIFDIPEDVSPASYEIRDGNLNILWKDGHASSYALDFIISSQFDVYKECLQQEHTRPILWDRKLISAFPEYSKVTLNQLLCEDEVVKRVVDSLVMFGVAFIEKVPANQQSTEMAVRRIFPIHKTLFGEMWTFSDSMDHSDTAYTKKYLGPHTDNTYFNDASGLQVLHCIQFNGTGGETMLIDGFKAAEQLKLKEPEAFERLCHYPVTAEYIEEGKHHNYCGPVIKRNIITGEVEQLRFNMYDRAVLKTIPQQQIPQFYADYKRLGLEIQDESIVWTFQLTPGTVMIFDNWRVLHGRQAYTGKRVMTGCYVSRTDFQSVARTHGIIS